MSAALAVTALATAAAPADDVTFDYEYVPVNDMHAVKGTCPRTGKEVVTAMEVGEEQFVPTERFWTSLYARFGFNKAFFKYFDHVEVFERIAERESRDNMRVCIERNSASGANRLLAVSNPAKPIVAYDDLMEKLELFGGGGIQYHDGVVQSWHTPKSHQRFNIGGDAIDTRFVVATPIDGYGLPNVYLALVRMVCTNGIIALGKIFRSQIALGKGNDDVGFALTRVLDQFGNDEGYAALRQRMESSTQSWASVHESMELYRLLTKLHHNNGVRLGGDGESVPASPMMRSLLASNLDGRALGEDEALAGSPIMRAYHNMTGDVSRLYGLANIDAISAKRQRALPVKCTVYDMLNFATELSSHHAGTVDGGRQLNAWVGTMLSSEFDMEQTKTKFEDFADFHLTKKLEAGVTGSENAA